MEVKIEKTYPLDVDAERAWTLLQDVQHLARCMPGADITEQLSPTSYKGVVKLKVGPALAQFGGQVEVVECDLQARRMVLHAKGADKGGSSASMDLNAVVEPSTDGKAQSQLAGHATVVVNGKFAQFGGRMMVQVSEMMLGQFVQNFQAAAQQLAAAPSADAGEPASAPDSAPQAPTEAAQAAPAAASAAPRQAAREINGLALLWALIRGWFASLFARSGR